MAIACLIAIGIFCVVAALGAGVGYAIGIVLVHLGVILSTGVIYIVVAFALGAVGLIILCAFD